jgi:flagellar hook-associated protein 1 FlgK
MAGLFSLLGSTAAALNAQSAAINVTGNNIANVNNPDYSRETVDIADTGDVATADGDVSTGMSVTVEQQRDTVLDQMVQQEASLTAGFTAQQSLLSAAQAGLGENITNSTTSTDTAASDTNSGLSAAVDDFFNAFEAVAAAPTDTGEAQSLVQQAGVLTDRFQEVDANLAQVQTDAGEQVSSGVQTANQLLQQIAQLNVQIGTLEAGNPGSAVNLRDQREGAVEQLAALVPVTATEDAQGELNVTTTDTSGNSIDLVSKGTVSNPLSYTGGVLQAGSTTLGVASGSLQGTITASTGAVQTLRDNLNTLAQQLVTSVNAAYNPSGAAGGDFFDPSGTTASTIALASNLTPTTLTAGTGAPGDNSIAVAVANVANQNFSTANGDAITGTISSFYGGAVSGIGQALDTANTQVTDQTNVQTIVTNQRASVSGVSVDEEMSNLMTYQRAYQASAEVLQVVSEMLSSLIQSVQ